MFTPDSFRIRSLAATVLLVLSIVAAQAKKQSPAKPFDLNAATLKELEELPGVGPVMAQRILDMRQKSGRFKRVEDLLAIRGISQKKLDAMRPYIVVSAADVSSAQKSRPPPKCCAQQKKSDP